MSCKRTQEFLAEHRIVDGEIRSANRDPIAGADSIRVLEGVAELLVAKGRKFETHDLSEGLPEDPEALLLGRSGKLRAPTLRVGDRLLVGYNLEMYRSAFQRAGLC